MVIFYLTANWRATGGYWNLKMKEIYDLPVKMVLLSSFTFRPDRETYQGNVICFFLRYFLPVAATTTTKLSR